MKRNPSNEIIRLALEEQRLYQYLDGTWGEFEAWIREKIGSGICWRVRPMHTRTNRQMIADLIVKDVQRGDGVFPGKNAFIEKT